VSDGLEHDKLPSKTKADAASSAKTVPSTRAKPAKWPADAPERRTVASLIPYARNARTHSDAQVAQIAASIREWGWTNPILVDETGGIIAGHGRVLAARKLKIEDVPCIIASGWSEAQKRAYILADNQLAINAGWDMDLLKVEIGDLKTEGFDLGLIGFDGNFLDTLMADPGTDGLTDPDDVPEVSQFPVSATGDVWVLGKHRLLCGDSTDPEATGRIEAADADMLLSDPPYGIGYEYEDHDDSDNEENAQLVADAFALCPAPKVWTPGLPNLARDIKRLGRARVLVWFKKFAAAGNGLGGASTWEPILVVGHTPARRLNNDVIQVMTERESVGGVSLRTLHSCPKPVALYAALVEALSDPGDLIYEPFSGSGTTLISCEKTGRSCRAIEITPAYVDVAVKRWQAFTGKEATLDGDGRTFNEVQEARHVPA